MSLSTPFIHRPVGTTLLTIAVALAGSVAFFFLPVSPLPQVDYPSISVNAGLPGADPQTMATSVATPLERSFGRIAGITEMTSSSGLGTCNITLVFDLNRDINAAARDVQAAINASLGNLPSNLPTHPTYQKINPSDAPVLILSMTSDLYTRGQMYDAASSILAQKIAQVPGVGQVGVNGGALPAVRVEVNPTQLNNLGLGLEDVRTALAAANANRPKGQVAGYSQGFTVYSTDQIFLAKQYEPLIVAYRNGAAVRLKDIATVTDSVEDIRKTGITNGKPSITLSIMRQPGANILDTVQRVKDLLPLLRAQIPAGMTLDPIVDRTTTIKASVNNVEATLVLSIGLVILVVFVFLRNVRTTLIPSVAVPVSLIGTFGVMYLLRYNIDNLSLMALTIATGFVVDDAIVVVENISRHIEDGIPPMKAALQGAQEIGFTVVSMSLSLIAVFIPILFMGGYIGRLFREFAVVLSVAIFVSMLISLTTTPMMCATLLKPVDQQRHGRIFRASEAVFDFILRMYERSLAVVLEFRPVMLLVAIATIILTVYLYLHVPTGFFPQQDTGRLSGSIVADQDTSSQSMSILLSKYCKIVQDDPAVEGLIGFSGGGGGANTARMFVSLKPLENRKPDMDQVKQLKEKLADAQKAGDAKTQAVLALQLKAQFAKTTDEIRARLGSKLDRVPGGRCTLQGVQDIRIGGRMSSAQYQFTVQDDDLNELYSWAPRLTAKINALDGLSDVQSDQQIKGLQATLVIDRPTAARLGITASAIDATLYDAFGQRQVSTMYENLNQYHVVMTVASSFWQNPDGLKAIYVKSTTGAQVPLSAFTHYETTTTPLQVNHTGQFPCVTISFNLRPGVALGDAVSRIDIAKRDIGLPGSIHTYFSGTAQAYQDAQANQLLLIAAAIAAVYLVLGMLYESLIHPLTILSTIPSAGVGALLALMLTGSELNVISLIGIILLIGIVKKNAIMMVDFALEAERKEGKSPKDSIFQAAVLRFRPITMTTMAALLGGIPLALGTGVGSELRRPLGIAIVGGLIFSQMLTLYTTPVIYLLPSDIMRFFRTEFGGSPYPDLPPVHYEPAHPETHR